MYMPKISQYHSCLLQTVHQECHQDGIGNELSVGQALVLTLAGVFRRLTPHLALNRANQETASIRHHLTQHAIYGNLSVNGPSVQLVMVQVYNWSFSPSVQLVMVQVYNW